MSDPFFPRLCAGTFFCLLTVAMRAHGRSRDTIGGVSGITQGGLLKDLMRVFDPSFPDLAEKTEKGNASKFKNCDNFSQSLNPFTDPARVRNFSRRMETDYDAVLGLMDALVKEYIDCENRGEWLVQALLQLIQEDRTIPDDMKFPIFPGGSPATKEELATISTFYLQPFLLGVWTMIILNVPDNEVGKATHDVWYDVPPNSKQGTRPEFTSTIGLDTKRFISVAVYQLEKDNIGKAVLAEPGRKLSEEYADYLQSVREKYSMIKTIMDTTPKPFYDFYVCNDLRRRRRMYSVQPLRSPQYDKNQSSYPANPSEESDLPSQRSDPSYDNSYGRYDDIIPAPTVDTLASYSHFIIIEGTGGLGKSMMMRHLMLNTVDRIDFIDKLPVFVTLRDYQDPEMSLKDFIFSKLHVLCPKIYDKQFEIGLELGTFVLLLDGLDEINPACQQTFDKALNTFADAYPRSMIIMTSRSTGKFTRFERFSEMELCPFSKQQALKLIDRLEFRPDEPAYKSAFMKALDDHLYVDYAEFAGNPLLLTFMLMRSEQYGPVPEQMHLFYDDIFEVLTRRHDSETKAGYNRRYRSGLTPERLKDIFAAFCALTYTDAKYSLTFREMEEKLRQILANARTEDVKSINPADLIYDFTTGVCMMYEEGRQYHFIHRSFQEYFCALSFSRQMDDNLEAIGGFFEEQGNSRRGDQVFRMLYDIIPDRVEKFIFLPILSKWFPGGEEKAEYWSFVKRNFPKFVYYVGDEKEPGSDDHFDSKSFLLGFLLRKLGFGNRFDDNVLPPYEDLFMKTYVRLKYPDCENISMIDEIDPGTRDADPALLFDPQLIGRLYAVDIQEVLANSKHYRKMITVMERENFLFMRQYRSLKQFLANLNRQYSTPKLNLISIYNF